MDLAGDESKRTECIGGCTGKAQNFVPRADWIERTLWMDQQSPDMRCNVIT